jgi:hypothetical protein
MTPVETGALLGAKGCVSIGQPEKVSAPRYHVVSRETTRNVTDYAFPQMFLNRPGANAA